MWLVSIKEQFNPNNSTSFTALPSSGGTVHIASTEVGSKSTNYYNRRKVLVSSIWRWSITKSVMGSLHNGSQTFYYQSLDSNILYKRNSETSVIMYLCSLYSYGWAWTCPLYICSPLHYLPIEPADYISHSFFHLGLALLINVLAFWVQK